MEGNKSKQCWFLSFNSDHFLLETETHKHLAPNVTKDTFAMIYFSSFQVYVDAYTEIKFYFTLFYSGVFC